jgi:hypothetical protein
MRIAVALANKLARLVYAILASQKPYAAARLIPAAHVISGDLK